MRKRKALPSLNESQRRKAERLYRDYGGYVYGVALELVADHSLAEDACHEAFVRIMGNIDKINEDNVDSSRKYLEIAVRNAALDILRTRGRLESRELSVDLSGYEIPEPRPGPSEILLSRELIEYLKRIVENLTPIYRDVFLLRTFYGHTAAETAEILGVSPAAEEKRFYRAKNQIIKRLEEYING